MFTAVEVAIPIQIETDLRGGNGELLGGLGQLLLEGRRLDAGLGRGEESRNLGGVALCLDLADFLDLVSRGGRRLGRGVTEEVIGELLPIVRLVLDGDEPILANFEGLPNFRPRSPRRTRPNSAS